MPRMGFFVIYLDSHSKGVSLKKKETSTGVPEESLKHGSPNVRAAAVKAVAHLVEDLEGADRCTAV